MSDLSPLSGWSGSWIFGDEARVDPKSDIGQRTAIRRNVKPFTLVIRQPSYACLTNYWAVLKEWRRLQCVNQTLKS